MDYNQEKKLNILGEKLRREYREVIIDLIIFDEEKKQILVQKRSANRRLFPGAWEFPGGLFEPQENLLACMRRNVYEECRMRLENVIDLVHVFTWDDDKDVATAQFLVKATGVYEPQKDKVSDHKFISRDKVDLLLTKQKDETPIYRGAFYAFEYLVNSEENGLANSQFEPTLFFDNLVSGFFSFLQLSETPPKITICATGVKRFDLQKDEGVLRISTDFLKEYDQYVCGNIILHQLYHNYRQNILIYDDVKAIRSIMGKNFMFYVDIVADAYTYLYFERHYSFTEAKYLELCGQLIQEYQADTLEDSKFTRLLGALLTITERSGQGFDVVLPVLDSDKLHVMRFDRSLKYANVPVGKALYGKSVDSMTKKKISEKDFVSTFEKLITLAKAEK
jgi:8-oxo-dGTP pyrophosphatase MutT (NUDIX family)